MYESNVIYVFRNIYPFNLFFFKRDKENCENYQYQNFKLCKISFVVDRVDFQKMAKILMYFIYYSLNLKMN